METVVVSKVDGKFDLNPFHKYFQLAKDGTYRIEIKRVRNFRSNNQNSYLWGVVYPLLHKGLLDYGWELVSIEEVHEYFKKLLGERELINKTTGEVVTLPISTRDMTTVEFEAYVDKIREYAREYLYIEIPEPQSV